MLHVWILRSNWNIGCVAHMQPCERAEERVVLSGSQVGKWLLSTVYAVDCTPYRDVYKSAVRSTSAESFALKREIKQWLL